MKNLKKYIVFAASLATVFPGVTHCFQSNFFKGTSPVFVETNFGKKKHKTGILCEAGKTCNGRNFDTKKSNVLSIFDRTQSSVAMFLNPQITIPEAENIRRYFRAPHEIVDNGITGHFSLTGKYEEISFNLWHRSTLPLKNIPGVTYFSALLPLHQVEMKEISWNDLTSGYLAGEFEFKRDISSQIKTKTKNLGNLDLNAWKGSGIGDIVFRLGWYRIFEQPQDAIKNVTVSGSIGLSLPTSKQKDEDKVFCVPFGNDGAWGLNASLGLDLEFNKWLDAGAQLNCLKLFDETRLRRLKTHPAQTDFLLLHKGIATLKRAPAWTFHLYGKLKYHGASLSCAYNYFTQDDDTMVPSSNDFMQEVISSSEMHKERSSHDLIIRAKYKMEGNKKSKILPCVNAFFKFPIAGRRTVMARTYGVELGVYF